MRCLIICLLSPFFLMAQSYNNQWIDHSLTYYKFPVSKSGIHQISYTELKAGFDALGVHNIDNIDPRNIEIYGYGKPVYIHIEGENDFSFDSNDFIEFYAQKNSGLTDSLLYGSLDQLTNPYYSNFNDTISYFLTLKPSASVFRLSNISSAAVNTSLLEPYFIEESVNVYSDRYYQGDAKVKHTEGYVLGEGWMSGDFTSQKNEVFTIDALNASFTPELSFFIIGTNNKQKDLSISFNGTSLLDTLIGSDKYLKFEDSPISINSGNNTLNFTLNPTGSTTRMAISYAKLKYAKNFTFSSPFTVLDFELENNGLNPYHISFSGNAPSNPTALYDLSDHRRIVLNQAGSSLSGVVPASNTAESKTLFISAQSEISNVNSITPIGNNGRFVDYSTLNEDSLFLIVTHPKLEMSVNEYAAHKLSLGHDPLVCYIDQLSDQFALGVQKHPSAIENVCRYLYTQTSAQPKHLFLIGKAVMDANQSARKNSIAQQNNLVPSYSSPACDFYFSVMDRSLPLPKIATGRLAALNNEHVYDYLEKAEAHQQAIDNYDQVGPISDELWHKKILHFGGGINQSEQNTFRSYLTKYKNIIQSDHYGANVFEFYKSTADPIDFNLADSITTIINKGAAFLSFFGHSSTSSFDIGLENPSTYNNQNKYFFILSNGCYAGDIHQNLFSSISEKFVFEKQKAAIGFIAQSDQGLPSYLDNLTAKIYSNMSKNHYAASIGELLQISIEESILNNPNAPLVKITGFETVLHGDPSLQLTANKKVDYAVIEPSYIAFNPENPSLAVDSFDLLVRCANLGITDTQQVAIAVQRTFPGGQQEVYNFTASPIAFDDTLRFTLPINGSIGVGLNTFKVIIDPLNLIDEASELNNNTLNDVNASLVISSNEIIPVYPYNYQVVDWLSFPLKASTANTLAQEKEYILQLDTTDAYNSPVKQETIISSSGGVVEWNASFPITTDSIVYFWRCSPKALDPDSLKWREHSFQFISGKTGWGQDHFYQLKHNTFSSLQYNKPSRNITYDSSSASLFCNVIGRQWITDLDGTFFSINGILQGKNACGGQPAFKVAVIDPITLKPWEVANIVNGDTINYPENDFGNGNNLWESNSNNCNSNFPVHTKQYFSFLANHPEQIDSLASMLQNKIPNGHYLLIYTVRKVDYQTGTTLNSSSLKQSLNNLGAFALDTLPDDRPWIFFTKIGDPSTTQEIVGDSINQNISLSVDLEGLGNSGKHTSPLIGPASAWQSLHWKYQNTENDFQDSIGLEILDQNNQVLHSYDLLSSDVLNLSTLVTANNFPNIKLRSFLKDSVNEYPAQPSYWHVLYETAPEAAINPKKGLYLSADTLEEGDSLHFAVAIENISEVDMDSLRVSYNVLHQNGSIINIPYQTQAPLLSGEVLYDTLSFSTANMGSENILTVDVNPEDSLWQIEQYHFNNLLNIPFKLNIDKINPLIDVTFDNQRILDGDIVSAEPFIEISITDNNLNKLLNQISDTSNIQMALIDPLGTVIPIHFNTTTSLYTSNVTLASANNEHFKVGLSPKFTKDGIYTLRVQAWDKSSNKAASEPYEITFEVVLESSITQIVNYPNPFSSHTQFVFTLTGSTVPDVFKIQILTVSGKLVREINKDELGPLHIGKNISSFRWDGTDRYGDKLANGAYLYRAIIKHNGEEIKHRTSGADAYFKKGFGKMYIIR